MSKPKTNKSLEVPDDLLFELLTPSEIRMIRNRWQIISLIEQGWPVRQIAQAAKVGTDTVVRMSKKIHQNSKIRQFLAQTRHVGGPLQTSKWVFGQVGEEKEL